MQPQSAPNPSQDRQLVDTIVYLASLASKLDTIDTMLDELRAITSRWNADMALNDQDRESLHNLQRQLKDYLIHDDPLREFTEETLEQRLQERFNPSAHKKDRGFLHSFTGTVLACMLIASSILFLPVGSTLRDRVIIAVPVFSALYYIVNDWYYISLRYATLKKGFVRYSLTCASVSLY
jgi:hypothetical protein